MQNRSLSIRNFFFLYFISTFFLPAHKNIGSLFISLSFLPARSIEQILHCVQPIRENPILSCVMLCVYPFDCSVYWYLIDTHRFALELLQITSPHLNHFFCCSLASIAHTHTRIAFFVDISLEIRCGRCLSVLFIFFLLLLTSSEKDKNQFRN